MATEIERKFLVWQTDFLTDISGTHYRQGYIAAEGTTIRVRIAGDRGWLTIKGKTQGISREEYEYAIPASDARAMLNTLCLTPQIEKTRHCIDFSGKTWEVDVFHGENTGLIIAEVELKSPSETIELPPWTGPEVSQDPRYFNSSLCQNPYRNWKN